MKKRPNILIVMTDQQRHDVTLSSSLCKTPNLDKMAGQGIRFNCFFPTMAHCCPSRASLMTSLYPSQHGIFNNVCNSSALRKSLNPEVETFSEKLVQNGYDLYYAGKWHVSATEDPADRGWQELYVTCTKNARMGWDIADWKEEVAENSTRERGQVLQPGWGSYKLYGSSNPKNTGLSLEKGYEYTKDYCILKSGLDKLSELAKRADKEKPWCLYIGFHGPHDPFIIPEKYARMYNPSNIELPPNYKDEMKNKPYYYKRMQSKWAQFTEEEVKESIAYYFGYCTMLDDMFGEALAHLEETGEMDDTLVVFLSDHGEYAGSHGIYCKGIAPYDEGYRVPLVIRWKNGIKNPGREIDELISIMDIAPTLIECTGSPQLNKQSGLSLVPFFNDEKNIKWRKTLYMQCNGTEVYFSQRIVRSKDYKFIYNPVSIDELYDLKNDPYELNNLSPDPAYKDIKKEYYRKMWKLALESDDNTITSSYVTVNMADYGPKIAL